MKKIILSALIISFGVFSAVQASVLKGKALEEISTSAPRDTISVKLLKSFSLDNETILKKNYILTGKMLNVTDPGKWHQNASFTFIPTSYTDTNGVTHALNKEIKATYRQKMKADFKHSEITAGPWMFSPSYIDNTKKIINGETKDVWDDYANRSTPWGKGTQIDIKTNETIYFNFPD